MLDLRAAWRIIASNQPGEFAMPSFLAAVIVAIALAAGAFVVLDKYQQAADHAYASPTGVRI
jgi:hypothetical protein